MQKLGKVNASISLEDQENFGMPTNNLLNFSRHMIESRLTGCIMAGFGNSCSGMKITESGRHLGCPGMAHLILGAEGGIGSRDSKLH